MEKKKFWAILLLGVCFIGFYFLLERGASLLGMLSALWLILSPFLIGGALAFVFNVPMRFLEKRVLGFMDGKPWLKKARRPVAMLLVLLLAALVVFVLVSLIVPEIINTISAVINAVPVAVARLDELLQPYGIQISQYLNLSKLLPIGTGEEMNAQIENMLDLALKGVAFSGTVIGTVYQNILSTFFTVMFTIYFLAAKERLAKQAQAVMRAYLKPAAVEEILRILHLVQRTFSSFITGQCTEAVILGGLFFVAMTLFHMPYPLLISIFIAVTALIPVIGAWIGCIVGALLILVNNPMMALWFVLMFLIIQQMEGNLIYPHVMGNAIGLPSIWVLFAVVLGEGLMGIVGMLLFIPLTSVAYALLKENVAKRLQKQAANP